jgi:hypothetical protein
MPERQASMLNRLFPKQVDNRFDGHRAALWLLGLFIALKLVMSINSILNTASVATGGDGLPLDRFDPAAARTVLMLFALTSLGQLTLAVIALTTLIRYRALVPLIYLVLLSEQLARRLIVQAHAVARTESTPVGWYVNFGLLALLTLGLMLSLLPTGRGERTCNKEACK